MFDFLLKHWLLTSLGIIFLILLWMAIYDVFIQKQHAIRHNFPIVGRIRYLLEMIGPEMRQYWVASDKEELPFNRAQRNWVEHAAEGVSNTVAFGSTRNTSVVGTPIFVNAAFPPLDDQFASTDPMVIGAGARIPFTAPSLFNIFIQHRKQRHTINIIMLASQTCSSLN